MYKLLIFLSIIFPSLAFAGATEDIQFLYNDVRGIIDNKEKPESAEVPTMQSPKIVVSKVLLHVFNVAAAHGVYKQMIENHNPSWYTYGVVTPTDIQIKVIYPF